MLNCICSVGLYSGSCISEELSCIQCDDARYCAISSEWCLPAVTGMASKCISEIINKQMLRTSGPLHAEIVSLLTGFACISISSVGLLS